MKNILIKIAALMLAAAALNANAQDKATLDLLVSKGVITQGDADKVSKGGLIVQAKEKAVKKITFSGRIQEQFQWFDVDSSGADSPASKTGFQMRRLYLGVNAEMGNGFSGTFVADFAKTGTNGADYIAEAFITKKVDMDYLSGALDLGYKKVQFGFEENTSSSRLMSIERSMATRYFVESQKSGTSRNIGFGSRYAGAFWQGKVKQLDGLEYGVAVTNSQNYTIKPGSAGAATGEADNSLNFWGNVSYSGKIDAIAFKVGVNGGWGPSANIVATGNYGGIFAVNPYAQVKWENLTVWGDFLFANVEKGKNSGTETASPMGLNIGAEYLFDTDDLGKIGPTIRYSWLDTDGRGTRIGDGMSGAPNAGDFNAAQSIFAGINWYIMGNNVKFQAGYEWAQYNGKVAATYAGYTDAHAMRIQVQVLF